jgi:hypothetical protein
MKHLFMLISALLFGSLFSSLSIAAQPSKSTQNLKALGSAWNSYHSIQPKLNKDDIEMGYAGQDISHSPEASATAIA